MRDGHRPSFFVIIWMSALPLLAAPAVAMSAAAGDLLRKDELVKQGDAICYAIASKVNTTNVRPIGSPFFSPQQIPKVVPHIAPVYASEVSRLGALQPTDTEASECTRCLD